MERNRSNRQAGRSPSHRRENSSPEMQSAAGPEPPSSRTAGMTSMYQFLQDVAQAMSSTAPTPMDTGTDTSNSQVLRVNPENVSPFRVPRVPPRYRPWDAIQRPPSRDFGIQYHAPPPPTRFGHFQQGTGYTGATEPQFFRVVPPEWPYSIPTGPARFPEHAFVGQHNQRFSQGYYRGPFAAPETRFVERQSVVQRFTIHPWERPPSSQGTGYSRGFANRVSQHASGRGQLQSVSQEPPPQLVVYPGHQFPQFAQGTTNEAADNFALNFAQRFAQDPQRYLGRTTPPRAYINSNVTFYPEYAADPIPRPSAPAPVERQVSSMFPGRVHIVNLEPNVSLEFAEAGSVTEEEFMTARSELENYSPSTASLDNYASTSGIDLRRPARAISSSLQYDTQASPNASITHETPQVTDRSSSSYGLTAQPDIHSFLGLSATDLPRTSGQGDTASASAVQGSSNFVLHLPPLPKPKSRRTELRCHRIPRQLLEETARTIRVSARDINEPLGRLEEECLCNSCLEKTDDDVSVNVVLLMKRFRLRCPRCKLFEKMKSYQKMCYVCSRIYNICFNCSKNNVIKPRDTMNFHSLYRNSSARLLFYSLPERERRSIMWIVFREWDTAPPNQQIMMARKRLDDILTNIRKNRPLP